MKQLVPSLLPLCIAAILAANAQAQHDFKRGYIVTRNNDTIKGQIDYGPAQESAFVCNFKSDLTHQVHLYSANDLKGYSFILGKRYVAKSIILGSKPAFYFLECLASGDINLYYIKNAGVEYYYIEKPGNLYELRNDLVSHIDNGITYTWDSEKYKGVLAFVLKDAPGISKEIQHTQFNRTSLAELIATYHRSLSKAKEYRIYTAEDNRITKTKWILRFGIIAGIKYSMVKATTKLITQPYFTPLDPSKPLHPVMVNSNMPNIFNSEVFQIQAISFIPGIFFNLSNNSKNSLQLELLYNRNQFSAHGFTVITQRLSAPVMYKKEFRYYKRLKPFFNLGINVNCMFASRIDNLFITFSEPSLQGSQIVYTEKTFYSNETNRKQTENYFTFGITGGLGLGYDLTRRNKLELEFRMDRANESFFSYFNSHVTAESHFRHLNFILMTRISF
jgi:hypothetical protein